MADTRRAQKGERLIALAKDVLRPTCSRWTVWGAGKVEEREEITPLGAGTVIS